MQLVVRFLQAVERAPRPGEQVRAHRDPWPAAEHPPGGPDTPGAGRGRDASRSDIPEGGDRVPLALRSHGRCAMHIADAVDASSQHRAGGRRLLENQ